MNLPKLSRQEEKIALLAMTGCSDQEVANELKLSLDTVRTYWKRIRKKMNGQTRAQIIAALSRDPVSKQLEAARTETELLRAEIERRRKAERSLRESEKKYRALFENSMDAIFLVDSRGCYLDVNPAAASLLAYERDELISKCFVDFVPRDHHHVATEIKDALVTKGIWEGNLPMIRKDGSLVLLQWRTANDVLPGQALGVARPI